MRHAPVAALIALNVAWSAGLAAAPLTHGWKLCEGTVELRRSGGPEVRIALQFCGAGTIWFGQLEAGHVDE